MKTTNLSIAGVVLAGALLSLPALGSDVHAAVDGAHSSKGHIICEILRSQERMAALHHSTNHVVGMEQTWGRDRRLQHFRDRQQLATE